MQELRLVAVSEDGTYLVLASAGRGTRFMLPVDDRLRAAVRGQFSRLGQYEIEVENPLRPKEIQARIRSGETAEAISEAAGIPIERVRWFEGPVLQEREYMAQQAQRATVRRQGESTPGPTLGDLVDDRVGAHQLETGDAEWDAWKREDNTWQLRLSFLVHGEERRAHWVFEPRRRSVAPADEEATRFFAGADADPADLGPASANVTPFVPRRQGTDPGVPSPEPRARELWSQEQRPRESPDSRPREQRQEQRQEQRPEQRPAARTEPPPAPPARTDTAAPGPERPAQRSDGAGQQRHPAAPALPPRSAPGRAPVTPQRADPAAQRPAPRSERPERPAMQPPAAAQRPSPPAAPEQDAPHEPQDAPMPAAAAGGVTPANPEQPRRKGRGRRASVPSWDEIMFGSKKSD